LSLVELLVALTILALLSTAGPKMSQSTQTSFVDGRTSLAKAKRNEAVAAFIFNDFVDKALPPTTAPRVYFNNQMPDVMQAAEKLAVATIFGTGSRFQFATPKCRLFRDADPDLGNVSFPADSMRFGQTTIVQRVNQILALGTKIVFSIDGTSTRCSINRPLEGTDVGDMAVAHVDDS
jgi:type II secretory pathway pseudopilin PulG